MHLPSLPYLPVIPGHCIYCPGGWNVLPSDPLRHHSALLSLPWPGCISSEVSWYQVSFPLLSLSPSSHGTVNYARTGLCLDFSLTVKTNTQGKGPTFPESSPLNEQISKTKTESVPRRYWAWGFPRMGLCFLMLAIVGCDRLVPHSNCALEPSRQLRHMPALALPMTSQLGLLQGSCA